MSTDNHQKEFRRILNIFKRYLIKSSRFEILYSPLFGYMYVCDDQSVTTEIITTPEHLCEIRFREMAVTILTERHSRTRSPSHASKAAKSEIRKCLAPYLRQLPEYRHLLNAILQR